MARRRSIGRRVAHGVELGLSPAQARVLARLNTPEKIQNFINRIPTNFEPAGDTCLSVAEALRQRRAHCIEGAFVAACALWLNGRPPLLMDLQAQDDDDHVVTLFRHGRFWGAISKSNHVWLRWRDPIYRSLRELAMSYFHEYVGCGRRTLRRYSRPYDLSRIDPAKWVTSRDDCWDIAVAIDEIRHYELVTATQSRRLRRREDAIEVRANRLLEFAAPNSKQSNR
jgi:hypothetical protein